ncbi:pimeloyl-ACP methyl ester carboxylesterase [Tamaricihabitans halophyticus]|uniref:Pimeloyl-ACP methyl ester carboxylesterase n=1 Tax=Tamaricihabitans halophyticus TaxID=1262583 RepID=A0A4R2R342_9PSEU|nr:alpha/beta hydrolase [Tamaricihabitans halophyticus]TCP56437.1 pimeloyl-ACP methyl ester carboxylesterase [Tamaricihabitans halophyticus]
MSDFETRVLEVPGARLRYDIRGDLSSSGAAERALFLIGSPMDAVGFRTLASYLTDRPLLTYDPRHAGRSERIEEGPVSPEVHADDLRRILDDLGLPAVNLFGSSGGALNGLVLTGNHPERVRTLIAHEPPSVSVLPDRARLEAACADIHETYQRAGLGAGMAKFLELTSHSGELPADWPDRPAADPARFGLPTEDDGSRDDPMLGSLLTVPCYELDFPALAAARTTIYLASGTESAGQLTERASRAIASRLNVTHVVFPSHHGGFLGDEYGMPGEPAAFASKLRELLDHGERRRTA